MRNTPAPDPYLLGSLRKGLEVIDCFARQETWSLAELAAALRQSKPTVFRILHTPEVFGYVEKDPATGRYALGLRFHTLGSAAVRHEQLRWQALPPLQDLARDTGETVHVGILYDGEAICVQAVDGTRLVRMHAFVGKRTPAHASALGKVLLAHRPDSDIDALIAAKGLPRFTPHTSPRPPHCGQHCNGCCRKVGRWTTRKWRPACAASARRSPTTPGGPAPVSRSRFPRRDGAGAGAGTDPAGAGHGTPHLAHAGRDRPPTTPRSARPNSTCSLSNTRTAQHREKHHGRRHDGADERRRHHRRFPDPAERALSFRPVRARQCRLPRCRVQGAEPHPHRLGASRQAAGHMADAYFKVRNEPVATFTSCGPGSANLVVALAAAMMDIGIFRHHRQRPDQPVQPRPVPGDRPLLPGRFPQSSGPT